MIRIDINELLNNNKSIIVNTKSVRELISTLESQYGSLDPKVQARSSINVSTLNTMISSELDNKISFLSEIVLWLEEVTKETLDQLIDNNHSQAYYEEKVFYYLRENGFVGDLNNNNGKVNRLLTILDTSEESMKKYRAMNDIFNFERGHFFATFDFKRFGLNEFDVLNELGDIYLRSGKEESLKIMYALLNNCPDNYEDFNFNPVAQMYDDNQYGYNPDTIGNYETNSEIININGVDFEFAQVLPKNCTNIERLAHNFTKAKIINTMRAMPSELIDIQNEYYDRGNVIVITCDIDAMKKGGMYSGFFDSSSTFGLPRTNFSSGIICVNGDYALRNSEWVTKYTIVHELGHRFCFLTDNGVGWSYNSEWAELANLWNRFKMEILLPSGYDIPDYDDYDEYMADIIAAYFIKGESLKRLCPDLYNKITELLGKDLGGSYTQGVDDAQKPEATPSPGPEVAPGPLPTPGPSN